MRYNRAVQPATAAPDFLTANDARVDYRDAQAAELDARTRARGYIDDPVTREIAAMFSESERHDLHVGHLARLHAAAMSHPADEIPGASERVQQAFARARAQGNYSSVEALARELDRDRDEEERAMILALMD